jgi:hypothetical protein
MPTMTTATTARAKLTIRVWDRLFELLAKRTDEISLRRDALLEKVISHEVEHLRADLQMANSEAARAHIEHHLKLLLSGQSKQVSLALTPTTAEALDNVCAEKNVPREAFLNRVILLLVAKPDFLDRALFGLEPDEAHQLRIDIKNDFGTNVELENGFAPLPTIAAIVSDPFWGYRQMMAAGCEGAEEKWTLYGMPFTLEELYGLNCFFPDYLVPGTPAYRERQAHGRTLLDSLGGAT